MKEFQQIETLIYGREVKKADILIARLMRSNLSADNMAALFMFRARTRLLSGRPDDAIDDLSSAQKLQPNLETQSDQFLELYGDVLFARFELASVGFADRNDTSRAQAAYEQLLHRNPNYSNIGWIHYQQGRLFLTQNNAQRAEECFHQALISASHVKYLTAYCYERLGFIAFYEYRDINRALAFFDRATDTYPHGEDVYWLVQINILRSRVYNAAGQSDLALKSAERALKLASSSHTEKGSMSEAILNITELLSSLQGHDRQTLAYLEQFTQQTKRPPGADVTWSRVYEMRGNAHFSLGQYDNAISDYVTALQFNPDHPWELSLYQQIARCHYKKHAFPETIDSIRRLLNLAEQDGMSIEDFRVYELLGGALFALKRYDEATEAYQSALKIIPPNTDYSHQILSYYNLAKELI
ncbi:MAG: tetratricopeptide repeat protein [Anaerolineaceae bacterium]|nr:tetratricopeptide repeat protein [Anaerolineaceae bacterium]